MKTKTKALVLACCAVLLVATTVFVTVAYLTDTETVTNTFTVGKVAITLDEAKVKADGTVDGTDRVKANEYKLMPGREYKKDPTVHIDADSEDCWVFVKVVNEIAAIEADTTVADQMTEKGWTAVDGATNVYAYKEVANASDNIPVFENFMVKGDVSNETLAGYAGKTIVVTAYAVQADGFDTAAEAWTAAAANFS